MASIKAIRIILQQAGSADAVDRETLLAHRADLLEVRDHAARLSQPGSPVASLFTLSDDVVRLIERIAAESSSAAPATTAAATRLPTAPHGLRNEQPPHATRVA